MIDLFDKPEYQLALMKIIEGNGLSYGEKFEAIRLYVNHILEKEYGEYLEARQTHIKLSN